MALFCECRRTAEEALRGSFIQTLTENSIAIQNMRGQGYDRATKDDNGSNKLVKFKRKYISLVFYYCPDKFASLEFMLV